MNPAPADNPKQLAAQAVARAGKMNSFLAGAQNTTITGGAFHNTQNTTIHGATFNTYLQQEPSLEALHKRVAPNALNAGGRTDDIRCYPGTRIEVIGRVEKWRAGQDSSVVPIFWLVGHAGTGKSAIMQTLSESWKEQGVPHASFFFNRKDDTRNSPFPLIATLLYQLIPLYPPLAKDVAAVVSGDPLVFDSKLEDQLARLIVTPLRKIQEESPTSYRKPTLLIDGLNECEADQKRSQRQILSAFDKVMAKDPCPFQLLVASRDEPRIQAAFKKMSTAFCSFYLDNIAGAEDDIRIFVNAQFELIKQTHTLALTITDEDWPHAEDVDMIVRKSSGQYIYAVTVMNFIMDSSSSPEVSLKHLRKPKDDAAAKSPFSQVDEVYTHILSQIADQEALKHMLYAQFYLRKQRMLLFCKCPKDTHTDDDVSCKANDPKFTADLFSLLIYKDFKYGKRQESLSYLADLAPIARYDGKVLIFHHASFSDFILSKPRAGAYFVDLSHTNEFNTWAIIAYFCAGYVRMKTGEVIRLVFASPSSFASLSRLLGRVVNARAKATLKSITL